jgi:putative PIN family toxin of toxin-antitoxin system
VIRAVFDTSALVRYLIRPDAALRELVEVRWLEDAFLMVTAPELIAELVGVLERPYIQAIIASEDAQALLDAVAARAEAIGPLPEYPPFTRDPKDDKFVACALAAGAGAIVTYDRDLLDLGEIAGVRAVTPGQFLDLFGETA